MTEVLRQSPPQWRPPESVAAEIDALADLLRRVRAGDTKLDSARGSIAKCGVYEEAGGAFLIRLRLPGGAVDPAQMRALAHCASEHGSGVLHFTSRHSVQIHGLPSQEVACVLGHLLAHGLSGKSSCGDALRGVLVCPLVGVCPHEVFDVSGAASEITAALMGDAASHDLPRKFKIGLSSCPRDCAGMAANDLGFLAVEESGRRGFAVVAGGGLGARSRIGEPLCAFAPESEAVAIARAVRDVFHEHSNRDDRGRARLRFLVEDVGFERFRALCTARCRPLAASPPRGPIAQGGPAHLGWGPDYAIAQRQPGWNTVLIPLTCGDIPAEWFDRLAGIADRAGERCVRALHTQNLSLRWIADADLPAVLGELHELPLPWDAGPIERGLTVCRGAPICRRGICSSSELAGHVRDALRAEHLDDPGSPELRVSISGCANGCARHSTADIGCVGVRRGAGDGAVPEFAVYLGGAPSRLGERAGVVTQPEAVALVLKTARARLG